jgi:hypothetical protein
MIALRRSSTTFRVRPVRHRIPTRAFVEPRFGHDFSRVRVYTGARAPEPAQALS